MHYVPDNVRTGGLRESGVADGRGRVGHDRLDLEVNRRLLRPGRGGEGGQAEPAEASGSEGRRVAHASLLSQSRQAL